ncbi:hypothetical protein ABKV19_004781 [Rosa sericea]
MDSMSESQGTTEDRLSALPDEVLCHILSFLPTKFAVMTTVLSKRWKNKWTAVSNLDFMDEAFHRDVEFKRFVSWVLDFRGLSNIQKFKLECSRYYNFQRSPYIGMFTVDHRRDKYLSLIRRWIRTAIGRNVIELDLYIELFSERNDFVLPKSLFVCKTLEVLKIGPNFIISDLPQSVNFFPSLKFLDVSVHHPDNGSMQKLFPHFPLLEDLAIDGILGQKEDLKVNISAPKLKTLRIYLQVDRCDYHEHNFHIKAPNLENLDLMQDNFINFTLETPNSLVKAEVDVRGRYAKETPDHAIALPEGISNVKYLSLRDNTFEGCPLPTFNNLNHLKLCLCDCNYGRLLTESLKSFPNLEHLDIEYRSLSREELYLPEFVPFCLLSRLKTISIRGFEGHQVEMEAAKYLLKNGRLLKKMTIDTYYLHNKMEVLYKEFLMLQRGSLNCQVEFVKMK